MKLRRSKEKILLAVWVGVIAIAISAGLGAMFASYNIFAGSWPRGSKVGSKWGETVSGWLPSNEAQGVYERVLYFGTNKYSNLAGIFGEYSLNDPLINSGQHIRYYQAIEEEYAVGLLDYTREDITRVCSSQIFYPELTTRAQRVNKFHLTNWSDVQRGVTTACKAITQKSATAQKNPIKHGGQDNEASKEVRDFSGVKNPWNFVDSYYAAQYLDSAYDVREYIYSGWNDKTSRVTQQITTYYMTGKNTGIVGTPGDMGVAQEQYIREYHFYPGGFLKALDEKYMYIDLCTQRNVEKTNDTKKDQKINDTTVKPGESYTVEETQCKGAFVERGTYSPNTILSNDDYDNWPLTEEWYEEQLRTAEAEVAHLRSNNDGQYQMEKGSFKGVIRLGNMPYSGAQDYGAARHTCLRMYRQRSYNILQGGRNVFMTYDTDVRAKTAGNGAYPAGPPYASGHCGSPGYGWRSDEPWLSGIPGDKDHGINEALSNAAANDGKISDWYKSCWERLKENQNDFCRYTWISKSDGDNIQTLNSSAFVTFESSYDAPFTVSSTLYTQPTELTHWVAFVLVDDPEEIAEDPLLRAAIERFDSNYKAVHGTTIYDDPDQQLEDGIFGIDDLIEKGQIVGFYQISDFSSFDPYSINSLVMGNNETVNGSYQIDWYSSREHLELGVAIQPGQRLDRGYQKKNRIYYGSIKNRTVEFEPTCYSGNEQYWSNILDNDIPLLLETQNE